MTAPVAIYTAVFGDYDDLPSHPDIPGVDFIAFTDSTRHAESGSWNIHLLQTAEHPRMAAKRFKVLPHVYLPGYEHTIWVDSSHGILTDQFADLCLAAIDDTGIAAYDHPWRRCIYDEAQASTGMPKYEGLPFFEQVDSYHDEGHPPNWGLWATGTLARRNTPAVAELMEAWMAEIDKWTYQDQLSFPVVCRRQGIRPASFPLPQVVQGPHPFGNTWTTIRPHHRDD
jgi:hypothetical protein